MRVDPITEMAPKWLVGVVLRAKGCSPGAADPGDPDDPAWDLSLVGWGVPRALHLGIPHLAERSVLHAPSLRGGVCVTCLLRWLSNPRFCAPTLW